MKKYVVFDPSYVTDNLGDFIIMDAINEALSEVLPEDYFFHIPSNDFMGPEALSQLKKAPHVFRGWHQYAHQPLVVVPSMELAPD